MENKEENTASIVENLSEKIQILQSKVEQLTDRLVVLEQGRAEIHPQPIQQKTAIVQQPQPQKTVKAQEAPPALFDTSALLPRISTICFLMVVALILRTITDNHIINTQAGSILGMTYAGVLILLCVCGVRTFGPHRVAGRRGV